MPFPFRYVVADNCYTPAACMTQPRNPLRMLLSLCASVLLDEEGITVYDVFPELTSLRLSWENPASSLSVNSSWIRPSLQRLQIEFISLRWPGPGTARGLYTPCKGCFHNRGSILSPYASIYQVSLPLTWKTSPYSAALNAWMHSVSLYCGSLVELFPPFKVLASPVACLGPYSQLPCHSCWDLPFISLTSATTYCGVSWLVCMP